MLAPFPKPKRVPRAVSAAALLFGALMIVSACSDAGLFSPKQEAGVRVQLRPQFSFVQSSSSIADISRIRLTITRLPGGAVVQSVVSVDPTASEWNLDLELEANNRYEILLELISVVGNVETVEYSGTVQVDVKPGTQTPPAAVAVVRGPPENLRITSVVISPRDQDVLEGDVVELSARTPGVENPVIEWATSNPEVAVVVGGRVTTRAPGRATITAVAGNQRDNIAVTVGARATKIDVTPANPTVASLGADVSLAGVVRDVRNAEVPGLSITWSVADTEIATQTAPGVFRALRNGSTTVTATTVQRGRTVTATTTLKVEQRPVSIVVSPAAASFSSFGESQTLSVRAKDANNNDVSGVQFTWTSSNPDVATVDAAGVVTARGNGTAAIRASAGGSTAEATVTVQQVAASMDVTPSEISLTYLGQTAELRAAVTDARGNVMNAPVRFFVASNPQVASVNNDGVVRGNTNGDAIVMVTAGAASVGVAVSVRQQPSEFLFNAQNIEIGRGEAFQATASPIDAGGSPVPLPVTWSSANTSVATVSSAGLIVGVGNGETDIMVRAGSLVGRIHVTVSGSSTSTGVSIVPSGPVTTNNCIPFGQSHSFSTFQGFIYRNVPAFTMNVGDKIAFDLGNLNGQDIRRDVYFGNANINPAASQQTFNVTSQGVRALSWVKVATEAQTPANPRGNTIQGDYELVWTAEAPFSFAGGGFIVGFSAPTIVDSGCEQVLVNTTSADPSGLFYARFYNKLPATLDVLDDQTGGNATAIGGMKIYPAGAAPRATTLLSRPVVPGVFASPALAPQSEIAGTHEWFVKYGKPATYQTPAMIRKQSDSESIK